MTQTQGTEQMEHGIRQEPRIVELPERWIVGMQYVGKNEHGEIPALWGRFNARAAEIPHRSEPRVALGFCEMVEDPKEEGEFSYVCGITVEKVEQVPPGMVSRRVPGGTYVVFSHEGKLDKLHQSYGYIWRTWMPSSAYEPLMTHDYELYDHRFAPAAETSVLELHVPVRPKGK